jgi:hypothetical protein
MQLWEDLAMEIGVYKKEWEVLVDGENIDKVCLVDTRRETTLWDKVEAALVKVEAFKVDSVTRATSIKAV